jgi:hypothetical protein
MDWTLIALMLAMVVAAVATLRTNERDASNERDLYERGL